MEEAVQPLALLLDRQDLAPPPEDLCEVSLDEEVVIVVAVDRPVACPPLAGIVLEPGAEHGQVNVTPRLHEAQHAVEVERPVGFLNVMEDAAIHECVETARLQRRHERITQQKPGPWSKTLRSYPLCDSLEGCRQIVKADSKEPGLGEEKRMSSLATTQVEYSTTSLMALQQMRQSADSRRRFSGRPWCRTTGLIDPLEEAPLPLVEITNAFHILSRVTGYERS